MSAEQPAPWRIGLTPGVRVATVRDPDDSDRALRTIDEVEDPKVALADSVFLLSGQLLDADRPGLGGESLDRRSHAPAIVKTTGRPPAGGDMASLPH